MEAVEATGSQTEERGPVEAQHVGEDGVQDVRERRPPDANMVPAQTQTRRHKGANKHTQTAPVSQRSQGTQTESSGAETGLEKTKRSEETTADRGGDAAPTPLQQNEPAASRTPDREAGPEEESPAAKSYAKAVSGEGGREASRAPDKDTGPLPRTRYAARRSASL